MCVCVRARVKCCCCCSNDMYLTFVADLSILKCPVILRTSSLNIKYSLYLLKKARLRNNKPKVKDFILNCPADLLMDFADFHEEPLAGLTRWSSVTCGLACRTAQPVVLPVWGASSVVLPVWGASSVVLPVWGAGSVELPVWGARSVLLPVWGASSAVLPVWGAGSAMLPVWGASSFMFPVWGANTSPEVKRHWGHSKSQVSLRDKLVVTIQPCQIDRAKSSMTNQRWQVSCHKSAVTSDIVLWIRSASRQ